MSRPPVRGVVDGEPGRLAVPKLHCRGCGKPVPKGRRNWCGQACIDSHLIRNNPATARAETFERDRGVCWLCERDTEALRLRIERWLACDWVVENRGSHGAREHLSGEPFRRAEWRRKWARRLGVVMTTHWASPSIDGRMRAYLPIRTLWEMDHIVPVVEGGGGCGLDNLRTLCVPCHRRETRALAKRRAEQRRASKAVKS